MTTFEPVLDKSCMLELGVGRREDKIVSTYRDNLSSIINLDETLYQTQHAGRERIT
jgi:hypothetical protein